MGRSSRTRDAAPETAPVDAEQPASGESSENDGASIKEAATVDAAPFPAPVDAVDSTKAAPIETTAVRPGYVRMRTTKQVFYLGMPYMPGELLDMTEAEAERRFARDEVEPS